MNIWRWMRLGCVAGALAMLAMVEAMALPAAGWAQAAAPAASAEVPGVAGEPDGQHDFDFIIGSWKFHLKKLDHPLTGSHSWIEFDGTAVARRLWDGRANVDEVELDSPSGHIEGLTLRLYDKASHQWSLYWANAADGTLGVPTVGQFKNGRGEFFDQENWHGRVILVRYIWSNITASSAHFEQSFSTDGGATWEVNWITDQVRQKQ